MPHTLTLRLSALALALIIALFGETMVMTSAQPTSVSQMYMPDPTASMFTTPETGTD